MTGHGRDQAVLEGQVEAPPERSHESHGIRFWQSRLLIPRLSGQVDAVPILVPEERVPCVRAGEPLRVRGPLRSFLDRSGPRGRLILTVYGRELSPGTGEAEDRIVLSGTLCRPPILRRTPLGRVICDLMLSVPRRSGKTDRIPLIAWGRLAEETSLLSPGDPLDLEGRIQSRIYHKVTEDGVEERTAYEVSMMRRLP